ncbi:site-specific DNA-methyltransferase [Larkinella punicea]|uniref:Methyltransferase n=2 Tax=Larkinella punicea TaxID=2315727 RepID=A0A368JWG3_9BACT|nr:site-specific DNA-methyltransferase [Larkinella punicea]
MNGENVFGQTQLFDVLKKNVNPVQLNYRQAENQGETPGDIPPPNADILPFKKLFQGDARNVSLVIETNSVDLIITSPPYWKKRDYGIAGQIGQENTPQEYVNAMIEAMKDWKKVLRNTGSIFINVGDTYYNNGLIGIPGRLEAAAIDDGWMVRNRIIWAKNSGMPDPVKNRLVSRHEYIIHFVKKRNYYYDLFGYAQKYGNGTNPGDIWNVGLTRDTGRHLAPFPEELVERAITLACPYSVCTVCGQPIERIVSKTADLDESRPQARRAMEIAREYNLSPQHIRAIQATGISDAGKAQVYQTGTGKNSEEVKRLAAEAKEILGGYFREFTFAKRITTGWQECKCGGPTVPGVILDPFMGTGTSIDVAVRLNRSGYGIDLHKPGTFD